VKCLAPAGVQLGGLPSPAKQALGRLALRRMSQKKVQWIDMINELWGFSKILW